MAAGRRVNLDIIGVVNQSQTVANMPRLAAGFSPTGLTLTLRMRPDAWLVRRGRLAAVTTVGAKPGPQGLVLGPQAYVLGPQDYVLCLQLLHSRFQKRHAIDELSDKNNQIFVARTLHIHVHHPPHSYPQFSPRVNKALARPHSIL